MSRLISRLSPDCFLPSNTAIEHAGISNDAISGDMLGAWVVISFTRTPPGLREPLLLSLVTDGRPIKGEAVFGGVVTGATVYDRLEFCSNTENWVSLGLNGAFVISGRLSCKYLQALIFDLTQGRHGRYRSHLLTFCQYRWVNACGG